MKANTGELIYYKAYEDIFNVQLTSSFLSAIFSFVKQTLKTSEISEIEVGVFRFIFEIERIKSDELLFALFSDRTDNLVELNEKEYEFIKLLYSRNVNAEEAMHLLQISNKELSIIIRKLLVYEILQYVSFDEVTLTDIGIEALESKK